MVSASLDQDLHFFDISLKRKVKTLKCEQSLTSVSFHSDGHTLAAGGVYGGLYVYDLRRLSEPKERLVGHDSAVSYVDFLKEKEPVTAKFTSVQAQNNPSTVITSTNPVQTKK
jgi:WD40 repeat protein